MEDGFLYSVQDDGSHWLCIPRLLAKDIFELVHDNQGHLGFDRCRRKMDGIVIYRGMRLLKEYIHHCPECLRNNTRRHRPYGNLQPIIGPPIPFHTVCIDFVVGLRTSETLAYGPISSPTYHKQRHNSPDRSSASLGAALQDKNDKNNKAARSAFAIGTLVAPRSFVNMPRTIDRQLFTHTGTYLDAQKTEAALARANFPKEFKPACNARDTMSSLHNALAVLMGDPLAVVCLMVQHHTMEPITDTTTSIEQSTHERA